MTSLIEQESTMTLQNDDVVLSVNGVSKKFCRDLKRSLLYGVQDITSEVLGLREKSDTLRPKEFWALTDVNFQLRRGEALGLIGKNGSGKSTLLRIIAGLIRPDTGFMEVNGRVAPLIALGAGFNPILTGRENIYANMAILGLSKQEIDDRFDEVIEFAEIGEAIDSPVQSYSSGMAARLGFASAIHTSPDILLIDEVLAVGDMKFRTKCYRELSKLRKKGTTFVLVSHDPNAILAVCDSAIYINCGEVIATGKTSEIMSRYEKDLLPINQEDLSGFFCRPARSADLSPGIDIVSLYFRNKFGEKIKSPTCSLEATLCIGIRAHKRMEEVGVDVLVHDKYREGERVLRLSSFSDNQSFDLNPGEHELQLQLTMCNLRPGVFIARLCVTLPSLYMLDAVESFEFQVLESGSMTDCLFYQPRHWRTVSKTNTP